MIQERRWMCQPSCLLGICLLLAWGASGRTDDRAASPSGEWTPDQLAFFEKEIRPVLVDQCYECHSAEARPLRGGLRLDHPAGWLEGGDSGAAVLPGEPDASLLIQAVRYESYEMPPGGKLPPQVIEQFERWVSMGAPAPHVEGSPATAGRVIDLERERMFWSFQPLMDPQLPAVADDTWALSELDLFIQQRFEAAGLTAVPDADRRTLIRRIYFDLIGLPPSPEEIERYLNDPRDETTALAEVVDTLLASPRFGERWGRHWLDLARYSDSTGGGRSMLFDTSWRYRDYVIDAFNADLPFDQFIREQLAGDLLPFDDYEQGRRQHVATAFLALGPTNYELQDKTQLEFDVIDEQLDTIGKVFLGMTIGCARCHDHKFDPIPAADYYALAGIFTSTVTLEHDNVSNWIKRPLPLSPEMQQLVETHRRQVAFLDQSLQGARQELAQLRTRIPILALDDEAESGVLRRGNWQRSQGVRGFVGTGYSYAAGVSTATGTAEVPEVEFTFSIPQSGVYEVRVSYTPHENRAPDALVIVQHVQGIAEHRIDQRQTPPIEGAFLSLGTFEFEAGQPARVTVSTRGAHGNVIADAVQLLPQFVGTASDPSLTGHIVADPRMLPGIVLDDIEAEITGRWVESVYFKSYVGAGYLHDDNAAKGSARIAFRTDLPAGGLYEVRLSYTPGESRAPNVPVTVVTADGPQQLTLDQRQVPGVDGLFTSLGTFRFTNDQTAEVLVSNEGTSGHVIVDAVQFLPVASPGNESPGVQVSAADDESSSSDPVAELDVLLDRITTLEEQITRWEAEKAALAASAPPPPPTVPSVRDADIVRDCPLCIRGNPRNHGEIVPRGFLSVIDTIEQPELPATQSGRLELAAWIADPRHPLTSRVYVNRVWGHLFGTGLVRTVDNFGTTGEPPSHPELLDHLARRWIEQGRSTKRLIRDIVLSRTYRLSSHPTARHLAVDPENRLCAWHSRRRLDAEALHDALLTFSGELDLTMGGPTVRDGTKSEYGFQFEVGRRAVYLPVFRNQLPDLFGIFDFPDPNLPVGQRNVSTLSTQALFLMNSPFMLERSRQAAQRLLVDETDETARIEAIYLRGLGRLPQPGEVARLRNFVDQMSSEAAGEMDELDLWASICQTIMASIEFRYVP